MPYEFELTQTLERKFSKLRKRNQVLLRSCRKKIMEIIQNPYHYKHLRYENRFRVHVGNSFILTYRIHEGRNLIEFIDIEHHDIAYL
ncbi:MAG: type II toxin-antitoxin system RelE/ParE family toxin [archaeon]|nr:type II toxin-antitoxin system RelE/ParE family toxin [archaeon]